MGKRNNLVKELDSLHQVDGKEEPQEGKYAPSKMSQLFGDVGLGKYGTLDLDEYTKQLGEYTLTDLQKHATKHNVMPIDNRPRLIKRLQSEFQKHVATYRQPQPLKQKGLEDLDPKTRKDIEKILSHAR